MIVFACLISIAVAIVFVAAFADKAERSIVGFEADIDQNAVVLAVFGEYGAIGVGAWQGTIGTVVNIGEIAASIAFAENAAVEIINGVVAACDQIVVDAVGLQR